MIHLKHSIDGYPLCWPMDKDGEFEGSYNENEVDCPDCIRFLKEDE